MSTKSTAFRPVAAVASAFVLATALFFGVHTGAIQAQDRVQGVEHLRDISDAFVHIADMAAPAVVFVDVESKVSARNASMPFDQEGEALPPFFRFFGPGQQQQQPNRRMPEQHVRGQGSGFIISPDGYVMTNGHVVKNAERISVTMSDGREFDAKLVGVDEPSDVAVIKINDGNLPYLKLGDSDALKVGEIVMAIGNPFGQRNSITQGIVSAKGRNGVGITGYDDLIQTDAAINPGNSGGPLLNLDGEVVGMNTAIISRTGGNVGIGFAIPVNAAREIKETLISGKSVERGFLGVLIQDVTPEMAEYFNTKPNHGAIVSEVADDSPAAKSGLQRDDIITDYNGKPVKDAASLRNMVAMTKPGDSVEARILRDDKEQPLNLTVGKLEQDQIANAGDSADKPQLGLGLQNLTPDIAQQFNLGDQKGVLITEIAPGSPAERAGLQPGMLIQEVNRQAVSNVGQFRKAVSESKGDVVLLRVTDGEHSRYATLRKE